MVISLKHPPPTKNFSEDIRDLGPDRTLHIENTEALERKLAVQCRKPPLQP